MTSSTELRAAIADTNRRLLSAARDRLIAGGYIDGNADLGTVDEFAIWEPLATRLSAIDSPPARHDEAMRYGTDYVGALPDGALVVWADVSADLGTASGLTVTGFVIR